MKRKVLSLLLVAGMVTALLAGCGSAASSSEAAPAESSKEEAPAESAAESEAEAEPETSDSTDFTIATIVKLTGVAWFDRMEVGVNQFAEDTGVDAYQTGANTADPAEQVKVIEDCIAQGVDAICVVPNSTESLETVLKKAMDAGIIVITHEASDVQNANFDIEAFNNSDYGAHFMDQLGEMMGGEGQYTTFVGSLTATSHNEWVDASTEKQAAEYPNMELVSNKNETTEDSDIAYSKAKELLAAYPDLVGFQGSAMTDAPGVARAIEEAGKADSTYVIGTSLVSVAGQYLESGAIDEISFWDPALAGYAMNELALMMLQGKEPVDGISLNAEGYQDLVLDGKVFYGKAWIDVTKDNMGDYDF
ncbi:MAG: autoinducer 2 ABC transporter substrate-binding protein [Lachnospiraceae bacterium]|nr:autoinducer 2 ABC transporter substrate-binding protein [Lachnospiraceae bacterium]